MAEKSAITREMRRRYGKASKTDKARMLDELVALSGWTRSYASRALRRQPRKRSGPETRGRKKTYTAEVMLPLRKVRASMDFACGKRMAAGMDDVLDALLRFRRLECPVRVVGLLRSMSAATSDRVLAPDRAKGSLKGRATTKPGTLLKSRIQVRTGTEWDDAVPGFLEIDLVAHCGDSAGGEYCNTLDATDIATCWTETRAVRNKAQVHVFAALEHIMRALPVGLAGIDSDNGSEFINDHLLRFCTGHGITFTRSRAYRKNDSCFVEQKNWSVVRRNVGYARFDTAQELEVLNELYAALREHTNYFMPSAKLISKSRCGAKVTKRYDTPATPLARMLASPDVPEVAKRRLAARYEKLNPVALKRRIAGLQKKLYELVALKESIRRRGVQAPDFDDIPVESTNQAFDDILR